MGDNVNEQMLFSPAVQWGFAGFSFVLLGIIVWLVRHLLRVLHETNRVISENTAVMRTITASQSSLLELMRDVHDNLISRPCLRKG